MNHITSLNSQLALGGQFLHKIKAAEPMKSDDGNDSIDTFIRQTIGKEPYFSFSRANENPAQWIQLLHALDQQDLPGWPLLTPVRIQFQKCDKCSREFCSTISYRRHLRLHRRKLNIDKDSATKLRGLLQAFWDKLSVEEAMEIMSFDDVSLEGVSGSSIIKALTPLVRKPGYTSLPHSYLKTGSVLLDIVQGRPPRFPISSQELFSILDDASENTFLCAGTAESLQKFVFGGDAGKVGLEMRNLIVCTCFLIERKLVKACLADKDAEALRYQKLLMEEEEAAQKRQAALLEKKRQKKLRQKERARELAGAEVDNSAEETSSSPPTSTAADDDSTPEMIEIHPDATPSPEPSQVVNWEGDIDKEQENRNPDPGAHQKGYPDLSADQNFEHRTLQRGGRRQAVNSRWQAPKSHRKPNGFHTNNNYQAPKPGAGQKRASSRDSHTAANSTKVWTPKPKSETDEGSSKTKVPVEAPKVPCQERKLLIGSIPVPLGSRIIQGQDGSLVGAPESSSSGLSVPGENIARERPVKGDGNPGTANRSAVLLWRPVNRHENGGQLPIQDSSRASEVGGVLCNDGDAVQQTSIESTSSNCEESDSCVSVGHQGGLKFSSYDAEAFLSQRWKEAITTDHVELVLYPEGPPGHSPQDNNHDAVLSSKLDESNVLRSAEKRLPRHTTNNSSTAVKTKGRAKPDKGSKVKYIAKQRNAV